MSSALLHVLVWVLVPIVVGCICLLTRRESRNTILVLSIAALALSGFDVVVYFLEVHRIVPDVVALPNYSFIDMLRGISEGVSTYAVIIAWAFTMLRTAHDGQLGWMTATLVVAMISLVLEGMAADPLLFLSRSAYTSGVAVLLVSGGHLVVLVTLIYALATRPRNIPVIVPPAPSLYQPMYPPPAPYGYPASYAPPMVLPTPQPQPPTMTPPS